MSGTWRTKRGRSSWTQLLILLTPLLTWTIILLTILTSCPGTHGRPSSDSDEVERGGGLDMINDDDELDRAFHLANLRTAILAELGVGLEGDQEEDDDDDSSSDLSLTNSTIVDEGELDGISQKEYIRVYNEYISRVKARKAAAKAEFTRNPKERRRTAQTIIEEYEDVPQDNDEDLTFEELFGSNLTFGPHLKDLNFEIKRRDPSLGNVRVKRAILTLPQECFILGRSGFTEGPGTGIDLTPNVTAWMTKTNRLLSTNKDQGQPFKVRTECWTQRSSTYPSPEATLRLVLQVITKPSKDSSRPLRRRRRDLDTEMRTFEGYQKKVNGGRPRDCDNTRHGKTCCRKSLDITFEELNVKNHIIAPAGFDAHVCTGRCNARRVSYATTHAMFQHAVHQLRGKVVPRPCCVPTRLTSLDVIKKFKSKLKVTSLSNAIVLECGCS